MGTLRGILWSAIDKMSFQIVQFIVGLIIARFVLPEEYGLIAMLNIILAISQTFIEGGFSNALVHKKDVSEIDFSTVFYFNIVVSVFFYSILYLLSPWVAEFYSESKLEIILKIVGLGIIVQGVTIVQRTKLIINMDFKTQAKITVISGTIGGIVGVIMAYNNMGVWALVTQSLLCAAMNVILLYYFLRWIPLLTFSWDSFRNLFFFGSKILCSQLLHTIYINLYSLVIGKKYSATDVGFYNRANSFAQLIPLNFSTIIGRVIYPMQCKLQDNEKELSIYVKNNLIYTSYLIFPIMIWISILSKYIIVILLTEKWLQSAYLLSILCIGYMLAPLSIVNNQLHNARGRSDYYFRAEIYKKIVGIILLIVSIPYGVKILCYGVVLYYIIDYLISIFYTRKIIRKLGYLTQLSYIILPLLLSISSGIIILFVIDLTNSYILKIIFGAIAGAASYIFIGYSLHIKEFHMTINYIKNKIKK